MKLTDFLTVVFDLDDTLYLEDSYVRSGFGAVGKFTDDLGYGDLSATMVDLFHEGCRRVIFDRLVEIVGLPDDGTLVSRMVRVYRSHTPTIGLLPDAVSCLDSVAELQTGLITDGPSESQHAKIEALDLAKRIDVRIVTADLGRERSKPHPHSFQLIEKLTVTSGGACIYVGDNPAKDFTAPISLGWSTVRIRRPGSLHRDVATPESVSLEVETLEELR